MSELQTAVSRLPAGSVVLYAWMFRDISGRAFFPVQALELLLAKASVPVYVFVDSQLAAGQWWAVVRYDELGARAGEVARRILQGPGPRYTDHGGGQWHAQVRLAALRRWGSAKAACPRQHRRIPPTDILGAIPLRIAGVLAFCGLQTALIIGLLVNRAKRRQERRRRH